MSDYSLLAGTPAVDDYRRLRHVAGLSEKTQAAAEAGLPAHVYHSATLALDVDRPEDLLLANR